MKPVLEIRKMPHPNEQWTWLKPHLITYNLREKKRQIHILKKVTLRITMHENYKITSRHNVPSMYGLSVNNLACEDINIQG